MFSDMQRFILLTLVILFTHLINAQIQPIKFKYYGIGNGLNSTDINSIVQDKEGYLWIGSNRGINRFNAYEFEDFNEIILPGEAIKVKSLLCDQQGNIWIGTINQGLIRYHPATNTTTVFMHDHENPKTISSDYINTLYLDKQNTLWIGTWFGLSKFEAASETFESFPFQTAESTEIFNYNVIEKIIEDGYGNLWIGTWGGGLHQFDKQSQKFQHFENLSPNQTNQNNWIKDMVIIDQMLWIATVGDGLFSFDIPSKKSKQFQFYPNRISKGYQRLLSIYRNSNQELWIGTEKGIIQFDIHSGEYQVLADADNKASQLAGSIVDIIFEDNHSGIWVAAGGLNYYNYTAAKFDGYNADRFKGQSFDNDIHSFLEVSENEIWISTGSGIWIFDVQNKTFKAKDIFSGVMQKMIMMKNGTIAAISRREGLSLYNPKNGQVSHHIYNELKPNGLNSDVLLDILEDDNGHLWIASNNGLTWMDPSTARFRHWVQQLTYSKGLKNKPVTSLALSGNRQLWVSNQKSIGRLIVLDTGIFTGPEKYLVVTDTSQYQFEMPYEFSFIQNILTDENVIWHTGDGLIQFDILTGETKSFTKEHGLSSNETRKLIKDKRDNLWIFSNNGVSYLNTRTNEITNFYEMDGLMSDRFNPSALILTKNGEIYVGGNNGFNIIHPDAILLNQYLPPTKISKLLVYNELLPINSNIRQGKKKVALDRHVGYVQELQLNHDQNVITIEFTGLNFLYPEKNEYAYMLEGVDKDWNYVGNRRFVSYSNLPVGHTHRFKVKSSNNNGIWNEQETTLSIYIHPVFWQTVWFQLTALFFVFGAVFSAYRWRVNQLKTQRKTLQEQVLHRTNEIEQQKLEIEAQNKKLSNQSEELKIQNNNIILLSEIGKKITASIELEDIFKRLYDLLNDILESPRLAIGEVNNANRCIDYWEIYKGKISSQSIPLTATDRLSVFAFCKDQAIFSNNIKEDIKLYLDKPSANYQRDDVQSAIYIPIHLPTQEAIGILVVKSDKRNAFEQKNVTLLKNIATYISIALVNSHTYQKIQEQSRQLKELDRIKTRFYTNISHEFRTPLSLVIGPTEELLKIGKFTPREKEYLNIILQNSQRLLRLVTQILDLSKLEDGVLRLEAAKGNIIKTVQNIAQSFKYVAERKNIDYEIKANASSAEGYYDRDKIEKIIYNLLNNAFKYTDEKGGITLTLTLEKKLNQNQFIHISIRDTGIGIPSVELNNIFQQYYRVTNEHTKTQFGAGIGLSLVKKLVELHHGNIQLESQVGLGSCFTISIPLHEQYYDENEKVENFINNPDASLNFELIEQETRAVSIPIPTSQAKKQLLLVEDNLALVSFMKSTLESTFEITTAENGQDALDKLVKLKPALIISDVMMPIMNGFELCRKLKSNESTQHIPVILLTAKSAAEDHLEGLKMGADEYLAKPLSADLLLLRIQNLLNTYDRVRLKYENNLIGDIDKLELTDHHKEFLRKVIQIFEENITNKDLNIDFFASEMGVSRTLLYEKIKKATGEPLGNFIKTSRLNFAAKKILESHFNTSELAYEVGFSDPKYFSKCFRKQFGKTPKEFLKDKIGETVK